MSKHYPEPGETWETKAHRAVSGRRPIRAVKIISCPPQSEVEQPPDVEHFVLYEYTTGPRTWRQRYHKLDSFVQRYERTEEADND